MKCKFFVRKVTSVIRGGEMFDLHYLIYKRDNIYRINRDLPTNDFRIYKDCKRYVCKNKLLSDLKDRSEKYCPDCKKR